MSKTFGEFLKSNDSLFPMSGEVLEKSRLVWNHQQKRIDELEAQNKILIESFNELHDLVWNHFLAKDSNGYTGKDRDKNETAKHWDNFHKLQVEVEKLNKESK